MGLGLGIEIGLGSRQAGETGPTVNITGLTGGIAEIGDHVALPKTRCTHRQSRMCMVRSRHISFSSA